jgi:hypothetical protein
MSFPACKPSRPETGGAKPLLAGRCGQAGCTISRPLAPVQRPGDNTRRSGFVRALLATTYTARGSRAMESESPLRYNPRPQRRRPEAGCGARAENGPTVQTHRPPEARGDQAPKPRRDPCRHRPQLQRQPGDGFMTDGLIVSFSIWRTPCAHRRGRRTCPIRLHLS